VVITSLLYRHTPDNLRLILVDPKILELSVYSDIPYLARPVVNKARMAETVLAIAVQEMDERYKRLAGEAVRSIDDFNRKVAAEERLPYLVIIVDELADMMMSSNSAKVELLITRLAQMARAVGIHLILATQRPSVDVITGLIKANFSSRIAFQVASKVDSRTILDANGAEKLLGKGDMLFLYPGAPEPQRIHGAWISSAETERIVGFLRENAEPPEPIENFSEEKQNLILERKDRDVLLPEATELVIRHKQGSVSLLQRRLGIGYQRAARLMDQLEAAGVVGRADGSKAREVLVDQSYLEKKE
jgi:S-DNA-T family DNA segregation ATPase FtsK/SpoIIIE